jgi:hypothetical protein
MRNKLSGIILIKRNRAGEWILLGNYLLWVLNANYSALRLLAKYQLRRRVKRRLHRGKRTAQYTFGNCIAEAGKDKEVRAKKILSESTDWKVFYRICF